MVNCVNQVAAGYNFKNNIIVLSLNIDFVTVNSVVIFWQDIVILCTA